MRAQGWERFSEDSSVDPAAVIGFWREAGPDRWFKKDEAFDRAIRERFSATYGRAAKGRLDDWAGSADGALALVILLDQFPRNMFRGDARSFATDPKALAIAKQALARGDASTVAPDLAPFLAMPLMHSEDLADQQACVDWMRRIGPNNVRYAEEHRDIIARFGRFPHRNPMLGRQTSEDERRFLEEGGFAG
ncbi:DUF924 family protein [Consotaella aegiceratis]|uniref:DUF924 family protein n=1 Tax=Consotaella aegiceratis TaxID=3097961 RepID=UPI002F3EDC99